MGLRHRFQRHQGALQLADQRGAKGTVRIQLTCFNRGEQPPQDLRRLGRDSSHTHTDSIDSLTR